MPFILDDIVCLEKLRNCDKEIKEAYEKKTGAKLSKPSPSRPWTTLGWKDTTTRSIQICALQWLMAHFKDHLDLKLPKEFKSLSEKKRKLEAQNRKLHALRVLAGMCIYITETNVNGELNKILKHILGVNKTNSIDDETRAYCLKAFREHYTAITDDIKKNGKYGIQDVDFKLFEKCKAFAKDELEKSSIKNFPCARIAALSFGFTLQMLGCSLGDFVGKSITNTTTMQNTQWTVTAAIGSLMYVVAGPAGIALLAPTIAQQTLSNMLGITGAYTGGEIGKYVGYIIGTAVGLPLDLTLMLGKVIAGLTMDLIWSKNKPENTATGVSLITGQYYQKGNEVVVINVTNKNMPIPKGLKEITPEQLDNSEFLEEMKKEMNKITKSTAQSNIKLESDKCHTQCSDQTITQESGLAQTI